MSFFSSPTLALAPVWVGSGHSPRHPSTSNASGGQSAQLQLQEASHRGLKHRDEDKMDCDLAPSNPIGSLPSSTKPHLGPLDLESDSGISTFRSDGARSSGDERSGSRSSALSDEHQQRALSRPSANTTPAASDGQTTPVSRASSASGWRDSSPLDPTGPRQAALGEAGDSRPTSAMGDHPPASRGHQPRGGMPMLGAAAHYHPYLNPQLHQLAVNPMLAAYQYQQLQHMMNSGHLAATSEQHTAALIMAERDKERERKENERLRRQQEEQERLQKEQQQRLQLEQQARQRAERERQERKMATEAVDQHFLKSIEMAKK
eukprot:maker-scaffold415_size178368-snap-gene-0.36 protein:Tk01181 transcript:maker-scaffold415_size178368-snap-gene-0.36-mRNA-1 annotation:"hypothetical protein D910_04417"